jgi:hypothetical protein
MRLVFLVVLCGSHHMVACDEAKAGWVKAHCKKGHGRELGTGNRYSFLQCTEPVVLRLQSVAEIFSLYGTRTCVQHIRGSICMCDRVR